MASRSFEAAINHMRSIGVKFEDGLSRKEIARIESTFKFHFPPDLKQFLQTALPVTGGFPNWRSESVNEFRNSYFDRPSRGILFDVEHNDFWSTNWGSRPLELADALVEAKRQLETVPSLIPIRSNHYLPSIPSAEGNPVLSVRQSDIQFVGDNIQSYLLNLFQPSDEINESTQRSQIPFWGDTVRSNRIRVPNLAGPVVDDDQQALEQLCEIARDAGFWAKIVPELKGVAFDRRKPTDAHKHGVYWILRRDFGWLICIRCPRFYYAPQAERIPELCLKLLEILPQNELPDRQHLPFWNFHLNDDLRREFELVAIQHFTQLDDEREKKLRQWESIGWRQMSRGQMDEAWNAYESRFYSRNDGLFRTPTPATTWSISQIYLRGQEFRETVERDLNSKTLAAFRQLTSRGEELLALDQNHTCYFFDPHEMHEGGTEDWAVPVLPDGDHHIFLARDHRFGIIGNCVQMTMCIFGKDLLKAFEISKPLAFQWPTWSAEVQRSYEKQWLLNGWRQLTFEEKDDIWARFNSSFQFDDSRFAISSAAIVEPTPSVTWAIKAESTSESSDADAITRIVLPALQKATTTFERLFAFAPPHWYENYTFNAHLLESTDRARWAVSLNPEDGFAIIVAHDLRFGIFVNPVEQSICLFGETLLAEIQEDARRVFGKEIRRNGIAL